MTGFSFTRTTANSVAPWLVVAAIAGAVVSAPIANTDTSPHVPYGTHSTSPFVSGYHVDDQDDSNTSNGFVDVPF
jgi:hypothetical protein